MGTARAPNGWITIDVSHECDLYWDLRYGIPFADGSVDNVYSSHLFEHLPYPDGQKACSPRRYACSSPGGRSQSSCRTPGSTSSTTSGTRELPEEFFGWEPAHNGTTRIDALNYIAYMAGEHKYLFDQDNLLHILNAAGFERVTPREFDPETDLAERDYESLYAIGFKPA